MISTRIHNKLNLYRRRWLQATIAVLVACCLTLTASAFQHRNPHKLRATALVEITTNPGGSVSTQLIPITILADGSFHDASIYESRPRPMALADGVVYEVEKTGVPVGYVTINQGEHTHEGWIAEGKWQPVQQVRASSTPKPATTPSTPSDDRPILHRGGSDSGQQPPTTSDQSQPQSSDDRPVLHRGGDSSQQTNPPADQPQSQGSDDRPVLHRSGDSNGQSPSSPNQSTSQTSNQQESQPDPEDPNRPVLKRRVPNTATPDNTPPGGTPAPTQSVPASPVPVTTPGTQTYVAVSDAQSTDTRSFEYHWKPGEEAQIETKMRKLALAQLPGENAQVNEHAMTNVVVRSFDVDLSNDAVVVITAEVPGGYLAPGTKGGAAGKFVSRYITVIARVDIDGNPQKLSASVTDSSRLDVAPRLELIDAVDVDGDGLAELLFREYDFDQKSFVIYGVGHGTVTKVFEGASEPLK
jgi:hypothetical protein